MSEIVYSDTNVVTGDGVVSLPKSTQAVYFFNKTNNTIVEVELNGGPHRVLLPDVATHHHGYIVIPGNYGSFEIITANATVGVFAIG